MTDAFGTVAHHHRRKIDESGDTVEADSSKPVLRLGLVAIVDHQDDVDVVRNDRPRELGIAAIEANVDRTV